MYLTNVQRNEIWTCEFEVISLVFDDIPRVIHLLRAVLGPGFVNKERICLLSIESSVCVFARIPTTVSGYESKTNGLETTWKDRSGKSQKTFRSSNLHFKLCVYMHNNLSKGFLARWITQNKHKTRLHPSVLIHDLIANDRLASRPSIRLQRNALKYVCISYEI